MKQRKGREQTRRDENSAEELEKWNRVDDGDGESASNEGLDFG